MYLDALIRCYQDHLPKAKDPQAMRDEIQRLREEQIKYIPPPSRIGGT